MVRVAGGVEDGEDVVEVDLAVGDAEALGAGEVDVVLFAAVGVLAVEGVEDGEHVEDIDAVVGAPPGRAAG